MPFRKKTAGSRAKRTKKTTKKRVVKKRVAKKKAKYGGGSTILRMRNNYTSWFPPRAVVKVGNSSDWVASPAIAGAGIWTASMSYNDITPFSLSPFSNSQSYAGLSQLLHSSYGASASIYEKYRVLWSKVRVEVFRLGAPVGSVSIVLAPEMIGGNIPANNAIAEMYPLNKTATLNNDSVRSVVLTQSINIRKFNGLTKEEYGQDEYAAVCNANPSIGLGYWNCSIKPISGAAELAGVWGMRARVEAMIELFAPWDAGVNNPTLATVQEEKEEKEDPVIIPPVAKKATPKVVRLAK